MAHEDVEIGGSVSGGDLSIVMPDKSVQKATQLAARRCASTHTYVCAMNIHIMRILLIHKNVVGT